jgi:hypothetical protein
MPVAAGWPRRRQALDYGFFEMPPDARRICCFIFAAIRRWLRQMFLRRCRLPLSSFQVFDDIFFALFSSPFFAITAIFLFISPPFRFLRFSAEGRRLRHAIDAAELAFR